MQLKYARQLSDNNRTKIVPAIQLAFDRYFQGETYTSLVFPPRVGKSSIIRLYALENHQLTGVPSIMVAPWSDNVDQIKEKDKIESTYRQYGVPLSVPFQAHRVKALKTHSWWQHSEGVPTLLTCTLGLINNSSNQQQFIDGLCDMQQRFGRRVSLLVDECQLVKASQQWGIFIEKTVQEADCYSVLLTGTPVPGIPGFECDYGDWEDVIRRIPRTKIVDGELKNMIEIYEGEARTVDKIKANMTMEWREAWDIGALAQVNAVWINFDVIDEEVNESLGPLSELKAADLNGRLRTIMESAQMMELQVEAAVRRLLGKRSHSETARAQALVITGADDSEDDQTDRHAKEFERLLHRRLRELGVTLRIEIATGNTDKAAKFVKMFRDGEIDILIVKAMGIVGLDAPGCKVMIWGSRMRTGPMAIQALSRPLTIWGSAVADIIMPEDCKMVELYDRVVKDQGGEFRESNLHLTEEIEFEPEPRAPWLFQAPRIDAYSDERGRTLNGSYELVLHAIRQKYPVATLTDTQIIEMYERGAFPLSEGELADAQRVKAEVEASAVKDLDEGFDDLKGEFGKEADKITNRHLTYLADKALWVTKNRELKAVAKELCGVPKKTKVKDIDDAIIRKRLISALGPAEARVFATFGAL